MEYSSLREQSAGNLRDAKRSVEALLSYSEILPFELHIKLETFRTDITAILEDRDDAGRASSDPEQ